MKESLSFSFDFFLFLCFLAVIFVVLFCFCFFAFYCVCLSSFFFVNREKEERYVATRDELCGLRSKLSTLILVEHVKLIEALNDTQVIDQLSCATVQCDSSKLSLLLVS